MSERERERERERKKRKEKEKEKEKRKKGSEKLIGHLTHHLRLMWGRVKILSFINSISTCTFVWLITRLTAKTLVKRSVRSATENIRYISTPYPPPAIRHPRMQILWRLLCLQACMHAAEHAIYYMI